MSETLNEKKIGKISAGLNAVEFWATTTNLRPLGTDNSFPH